MFLKLNNVLFNASCLAVFRCWNHQRIEHKYSRHIPLSYHLTLTPAQQRSLQFCVMKIFHLFEHAGFCQLDNWL